MLKIEAKDYAEGLVGVRSALIHKERVREEGKDARLEGPGRVSAWLLRSMNVERL